MLSMSSSQMKRNQKDRNQLLKDVLTGAQTLYRALRDFAVMRKVGSIFPIPIDQ